MSVSPTADTTIALIAVAMVSGALLVSGCSSYSTAARSTSEET